MQGVPAPTAPGYRDTLRDRALLSVSGWSAPECLALAHQAIVLGDTETARWLALRAVQLPDGAGSAALAQALWKRTAGASRTDKTRTEPESEGAPGQLACRDGWVVGQVESAQENCAIDIELDGRFIRFDLPSHTGGAPGRHARRFRFKVPPEPRVIRVGFEGRQLQGSPLVQRHQVERFPESGRPCTDPDTIWILVPVHGAAAAVHRCIASLLEARNRTPLRIVVVDDATTDAALTDWLTQQATAHHLTLLRRPVNGGFVAAVNTGLRFLGPRDVVLLNSDTIVVNDWLDRLVAAAYSAPDVGAVNPLSNNAELLSFPGPTPGGSMPDLAMLRTIDRHLATRHRGRTLETPAGVGFCWYLRGDALRAIGLLDDATVQRGYGEDTDLSIRLQRAGWRLLAALDTFVAHEGGQSFGAHKDTLARRNVNLLSARFPEHGRAYRAFLSAGELDELRRELQRQMLAAGVAHHATLLLTDESAWLRRLQFDAEPCWAMLPVWSGNTLQGVRIAAHAVSGMADITYAWPGQRTQLIEDLHQASFRGLLRETFADWSVELIEAIAVCRMPLQVQLIDASAYCPRRHANDHPRGRCAEPAAIEACQACVATHGPLQRGTEPLAKWRETTRASLRTATRLATSASDLARRLEARTGIPFESSRQAPALGPRPDTIRRIGFIGVRDFASGFALSDLAWAIDLHGIPLRLVILGECPDEPRLARHACIELPGSCAAGELHEMLGRLDCDALGDPGFSDDGWVRALGEETGLPVLARAELEGLLASAVTTA